MKKLGNPVTTILRKSKIFFIVMRSARELETQKIIFQASALGKKPPEGTMPIDIPMYKAAKKKISIESWRKDSTTSPGATRYMVPSLYGTYVEFDDNKKTITIIGRGDSAVKSVQNRLKLKASYQY